jgi:predicted amidohydrolase
MRAHLVQLDIAWEQPGTNHEKVRQLLDAAPVEPGDLVVLPEMFDTGFSMRTEETADTGATVAFLIELAEDLGVTVQGGRTVSPCHACKAYNVMTTIGPPREGRPARLLSEFRKVHLFPLGEEKQKIEGGREVDTYVWHGPGGELRVCPAICYDLRFPELFRRGLGLGAELFALGACWLEGRHAHWKPLLVARAIENQAFVLGVNRTGRDPNSRYLGGSVVIGPKGEVLGELGEAEGVLSVEIDPAEVRSWREKFPAWRDRVMGV